MAFLISLRHHYHHRRHYHRPILRIITQQSDHTAIHYYLLSFLCPSHSTKRWLSTSTESTRPEFVGQNAYDLLGVSETSSFAEIKASFRKLAKETHPDLSQSHGDSSASEQFVRILAAYEILSDYEKRAHYDRYLLSQRTLVQKHYRQGSIAWRYESHGIAMKQMEVVEWLRWYRYAIKDILLEKRVVVGSGYFDVLERDFYSAIHAAYYGPEVETMDLLPECFEAEERSMYGTPEVLHLVSGRDLFGMVCLSERFPALSQSYNGKLESFASRDSELCKSVKNVSMQVNSGVGDVGSGQMESKYNDYHTSDAYKDLELHVSGRMVAMAIRLPPKSYCNGIQNEDSQDHIHIYLSSHQNPTYVSKSFPRDSFMGVADGSSIPMGTITGLGSDEEEGSCFIYNYSGIKTHVIMKHRTLLVKHMHWYQVGEKVSVCECRCSRARLPPSKFWLFEPRCGMHDIGGWYVETFGRDKKGRTVPSQRYWDGLEANEQLEKRLHPAVYLLALAYRTLDLEDARRKRQTVRGFVEGNLLKIINWCKKLV